MSRSCALLVLLATPAALAALACGGAEEDEARATPEERLRLHTAVWEGTPYRDGGRSRDGIDCSAFVQLTFEEVFQRELPRSAERQERAGRTVPRGELATGDLVFFRTKGIGPFFKKRHVGIYVGAGDFAHASSSRGVTISSLQEPYWRTVYHGARRVLASENNGAEPD